MKAWLVEWNGVYEVLYVRRYADVVLLLESRGLVGPNVRISRLPSADIVPGSIFVQWIDDPQWAKSCNQLQS